MLIGRFVDWMTGGWRPQLCGNARRRPPTWQRPDLIDPPLRPLPPSRQRRLTSTQDTHAQLQSTIIARLPAEIRILIWEHALGRENDKDVLHLELADGTLRHNRCYERDSDLPVFKHSCWTAAWRMSFRTGGARGRKEPIGHRRAILPLLFTCKLIYTESVDLLYSANTFDFRRTDGVIRLPSVILPDRLQQLRRVQISTAFACYNRGDMPPGVPADFWKYPDDRRKWPAACKVLASLQRLQYVRVTIVITCQPDRHRYPTNPTLLYEILEPLKAVSAREFIVEVTELLETMRERLGTTPFHLVEREPPVSSVPLSSTVSANSPSESGARFIRSVDARSSFHVKESEK